MPRTASPSLDQLRLLPEDDRVASLLQRDEDQWFDRISARTNPQHLADTMAGFANAEGGLVAVGLHGGSVEGISAAGRLNAWRQAALDFTRPPVRHRLELLPCVNAQGQPDEVLAIEIEASERVHEARGETFLRIGDENRRLGPVEAMELRYDKGDSVYDGSAVADGLLNDLDDRLVTRYLDRVRARSEFGEVLAARGLMARHGNLFQPTVAGILVLGHSPQRLFGQATLRIVQYNGPSRETGTRMNVVYDQHLDGTLGSQIDQARRRLRRLIPAVTRLETATSRFERRTLIPESAWLEAIVNALVHRSYTIGGDHVRVELFSDRLEVESPGRLPGLVRVETIRSTRFARNPRIARAMADLGYGRELGEGVNRMFEEMERAGLPDPIYSQSPASVKVTFLADTLVAKVLDALPPGSETFAEYLSRTERVTTSQALDLLATSRPTALGHLHRLADLGLLEHVGTSLKDPRGYWRLRRGDVTR